jgi:chromosome segregation ATPase
MKWFKEKTRTVPLFGITGEVFMGTFGVSDDKDRQNTLRWMLRQVDVGAMAYRSCKSLEELMAKSDAEIRGLVEQNKELTAEVVDLRELVDSADKALDELDSAVDDLEGLVDDLDDRAASLNTQNNALQGILDSVIENLVRGEEKKVKRG